jgi:hypothetical protein
MSFLRLHADEAKVCASGPHLGRQRSVEVVLDMTEAQWMAALSFMLSQTDDAKLRRLLATEYPDLLTVAA